jgi:VWFA-related protein
MKKNLPALILFTFFAVFTFAQTPTPTPKPTENTDDVVKISTTLIQVDVTVTDKNGKVVTDLKPEDFEIFENGEKQNISNFSYINTTPEAKAAPTPKPDKNEISVPIPPVQIRPEQVRRTIALVVDDLGISFESMHFVRRALKKFVDEQMLPNDLVAIIRTGGGVGALQQFTSDKRQLYAAIEKIRWNPMGRAGIGAFTTIEPSLLEELQAAGDTTITEEDIQDEKDRNTAFNEMREDLFSVGTLGAINFVVKGMDELPGRKAIMLFSDGFSVCTETDLRNDPGRCTEMTERMKELTDLCNRAAVNIYSIDSRGLQTLSLTAADRPLGNPQAIQQALRDRAAENWDKQEGLAFLANETGGRAFFNNNDFNQSLEKALDEQKGYYLLAYQPDDDTFDAKTRRFNKLTVKVNRPGANVRYRSGFFSVADKEEVKQPVQATPAVQIQRALTSPFAVNGINLRLNTLFGFNPTTGSFTNSLLHVNAADLQFNDAPDGKKKASFDVLAVSFGENGVPIDTISKNYVLTVSNEMHEKITKDGFVYHFLFPVKKPGAFQMRVAIRDTATSKVGSANQFVEAPDLKKGRLTLSGIVLENMTENQWNALQTASSNNARERGTDPMQDTSLRRFKKGTILRYAVEVYNAKFNPTQKPEVQTQIRVFRDGKLILNGKTAPFNLEGQTDFRKLNFSAALALGSEMSVGDYVLQIIVIDNSAKKKNKLATQWVQFEVID